MFQELHYLTLKIVTLLLDNLYSNSINNIGTKFQSVTTGVINFHDDGWSSVHYDGVIGDQLVNFHRKFTSL